LTEFSVRRAECFCCSVDHKGPDSSEDLFCDRELVEACIISWFGSVETFESEVQSKLFASFERQLGRYAFPYHWLICSMSPALWAHMDMMGALARISDLNGAMAQGMYALSFWLCSYPLFFVWCVKSAAVLRKKRRGYSSDALVSVGGALAGAVPACSVWWISHLHESLGVHETISSAVLLVLLSIVTILVWQAPCR